MNAHQNYERIITANGGEITEFALEYADKAGAAMNEELRAKVEAVFDGIPGIDAGVFLRLYCELHLAKFEQEFSVRA